MATAPNLADWWRQYARDYNDRSWRDYRHLLAEMIRYSPGPPMLDVGCGFGFLVECARQFGLTAIGLEASEQALAECRRRHPRADVRRWHAGERLPFDDGIIGAAMLNQVVDHVSLEANRLLFAELHRVLQADGILLVHSPSKYNRVERRSDSGHITFFGPSEFRAFVGAFGFDVLVQPYHAQRVFDSRLGWLMVRAVARAFKPERLAATIDLVAAKRPTGA
jgi:SAM-dependent methyltransferase